MSNTDIFEILRLGHGEDPLDLECLQWVLEDPQQPGELQIHQSAHGGWARALQPGAGPARPSGSQEHARGQQRSPQLAERPSRHFAQHGGSGTLAHIVVRPQQLLAPRPSSRQRGSPTGAGAVAGVRTTARPIISGALPSVVTTSLTGARVHTTEVVVGGPSR